MAKNPITILNEGNKLLDELERKLVGVNSNLLEISKTARGANLKDYFNVKAPNEVNEKLKLQKTIIEQLNAEVRERDRLEKALSNQLAKNKLAESEINKELVKQRFETQERNKQIKASVILSSKLSTEYQKLVVRMNQAGRAKQNLVAKQAQGIKLSNKEQAELKQSSIDFKRYQKAVLKADASIGRFQRNVGNYGSALGKAGLALRNFAGAFGVLSAGTIALEIFNLTKEIDGLDKALLQVTETQEGFGQAQTFIKNLAEEAGVEINGLQKAYTKFFAAAKTTNLTLEETQDIFRQTAKAGAVLGLSTDDINGSMRALEQILSKGKVQAEEIRGQLGERLPGAFQILAKSMGLTTQELSKQLELGNVLSDEVLPGFAKELEKTYSLDKVNRIDTITAAQNRLSNAWSNFVRDISGDDSILNNTFKGVLNFLTSVLEGVKDVGDEIKEAFESEAIKAYQKEQNNFLALQKRQEDALRTFRNESERNAEAVRLRFEIEDFLANKIFENQKQILGVENARKENADAEANRIVKTFDKYNDFKALIEDLGLREDIYTKSTIATAFARIKGIDAVLKKTKKEKEVSEEIDENTKNTKKLIEGSVLAYQKLITELENERDELSTSTSAYNKYNEKIDAAKKKLEELKNGLKSVSELKSSGTTFSLSITGNDLQDEIDAYKEGELAKVKISEQSAMRRRELEQELAYSLLDLGNTLFDAKIQRYDDEIQKNDDYYAQLLNNEQLTEQQRSALEAERDAKNAEIEKKKRDEQRKQAIFNKAAALSEIAINTAIGVSADFKKGAILGGITSALTLAMGAIQAATVIATPIPQYKDGKRQGEGSDGVALLNDGGKDELRISEDGSIERIKGRNVLAPVLKSDTIIPDADKYLSSMSDAELYENLHKHTIMASMQGQSDTINAYLISKSINNQTDRMIKAFSKNKPKVNVYNNINNSVGEDIKYLMSLNDTL